jgi:hypothetical protein
MLGKLLLDKAFILLEYIIRVSEIHVYLGAIDSIQLRVCRKCMAKYICESSARVGFVTGMVFVMF